MNWEQRIVSLAVVTLFALAISLPLIDNAAELDPTVLRENRDLAEKPKWEWNLETSQEFPEHYEEWYKDHFGFRNMLIYSLSLARYKVLHQSPHDKVIVGQDDWLFHAHCERSFPKFQQTLNYSDEQLTYLKNHFERQRDKLAERGIDYYLLIAADKQSIYAEHLPRAYERSGDTDIEQFVNYMREHSTVSIIDARQTLIQKKPIFPLYYKADHHWNYLGAYFVAAEALRVLAQRHPEIPQSPPLSAYSIDTTKTTRQNNLARLMGLQTRMSEPEVIPRRKTGKWLAQRDDTDLAYWWVEEFPPMSFAGPDKTLPRVVMFHDSFGIALRLYLAQAFSRFATYRIRLWPERGVEMSVIDHEKPDIVIEEILEHKLVAHLFPPELDYMAP